MNSHRTLAGTSPPPNLRRRIERALVGVIMTIVVLALERAIARSLSPRE